MNLIAVFEGHCNNDVYFDNGNFEEDLPARLAIVLSTRELIWY